MRWDSLTVWIVIWLYSFINQVLVDSNNTISITHTAMLLYSYGLRLLRKTFKKLQEGHMYRKKEIQNDKGIQSTARLTETA